MVFEGDDPSALRIDAAPIRHRPTEEHRGGIRRRVQRDPVAGERIGFRKTAAATDGELLAPFPPASIVKLATALLVWWAGRRGHGQRDARRQSAA